MENHISITNPELPKILKYSNFNSGQFCPSLSDNDAKTININISEVEENALDHTLFFSFHDDILTGYMDYMSGEQPVLYKMKELWNFWSKYLNIDKKLLKKIQKAQNITIYKSIVTNISYTY